ncbi:MAG: hypothetical protein QOJ62_2068, partial [Actinomycetota bacterium]|nr:hypothetical protein [Actinomycetota bacterium]
MNPRLRVTAFSALATLLGSLSLLPVYETYSWLPRVVLIIAVVSVTSALVHRVRALAIAAPLAMAIVWAGTITLLYAHQVAPLGFIPGPAALRLLHQTVSSGFTDTTELAAPVAVTRGLSLLTTGGIGLVAIVVETLATGLRRPAVAGLPLLAIFTVPAAILSGGVGWQPFVYAAAGYLALLLAEGRDRISRWGRPVRAGRPATQVAHPVPITIDASRPGRPPGATRTPLATNQLTQVGRRVGAASIGLAIAVPLIIPGLHAGWFGTYHTNGSGGLITNGNGSGGSTLDPMVSLQRDLIRPDPAPLFTYTTSGQPQYLRLLTLDTFDGTSWRASAIASPSDTKTDKALPAPPGVTVPPSASVQTNVTITGLREPYLAVPGTPTAIKAKGTWIYNPINSVVYSKRGSTVHLSYQVTSNTYNPSQSYLASLGDTPGDASVNNYLAVPNDLPASIQLQADLVIADAHATTAFDKAMALQSWFLSAFTYDLNVKSGSDASALESFLSDKRGYCQQFAATMALMARLEGIPARVDIGFTPGAKVNGTSTYLVTTADAHAWPELYFKGAGWLRFEPTPRADGQTSSPSYATGQATTPSVTSPSTARPTTVPTGPGAQAPDPIAPKGNHKVPGTVTSITHVPTGWLITLGVIVLLILASPGVRLLLRRRRWTAADTEAARAHAAWEELGDDLRDLRLDWHGESDTPRRAAAALVATRRLQYDTTAQQALARLTRAEELARYAARPDELRWVDQDPRADQESVRRALFGSVSRTRRLRAR